MRSKEEMTLAKVNVKLFFVGVIVGAVVAPIGLFSAGWVLTSGAAGAKAQQSADAAIVANLTPICLSQFSKDAKHNADLAKLRALDQWTRPDFVTKSGWATMPGGGEPNSLVATECARRLVALDK